MTKRILITCTNLISTIDDFKQSLASHQLEYDIPEMQGRQQLTEEELVILIKEYDGWIAGDDPATYRVLEAGARGNLKALVKWGIGTDSIDKKACEEFKISFSNTPGMFGNEVADSALSYLLCMCRQTHEIDTRVRIGKWYKPLGTTLADKRALIIGYGDIGKQVFKRLHAFGVKVFIKDPYYSFPTPANGYPHPYVVTNFLDLNTYDFVILCCPLVSSTHHLVDDWFLNTMKKSAIMVNVSRGPVVDTNAMVKALENKEIGGYATDVFEVEPLPLNSKLRLFENTMFGSHNSSNTKEGVHRTNVKAIELMARFLNQS
jgi:D-3-phosphoglycerate dehydrogenase